jgi:uncharacterized RDD family membrane protein YckC
MTTMPPDPPDPTGGTPAPPPPPPGYGPPPAYGTPMSGAPMGMPAAGAWAGPPLAEWPQRVAAALIDGVIIGVAGFVVGLISSTLGSIVNIGLLLYFLYMQGTTGATVGKGVMKIKVLREADGQVIGFGMSVVRYIVHIVDFLPCLLGYLWPLWDKKKQTFADKIISTVVVQSA